MLDHGLVYSIGKLAEAAGVSAPTVRYYETIGLLPRPKRSEARQRVYRQTDLERVVFVRRCRDFGFPIEEVRRLLDLAVRSDEDCAAAREIAAKHLVAVQRRLADLAALEIQLAAFVRRCDDSCTGGPSRECSIFEDIAGGCATCGG